MKTHLFVNKLYENLLMFTIGSYAGSVRLILLPLHIKECCLPKDKDLSYSYCTILSKRWNYLTG